MLESLQLLQGVACNNYMHQLHMKPRYKLDIGSLRAHARKIDYIIIIIFMPTSTKRQA